QSAIAQVLAEARRLADAVPQLLEAICVHAGWSAGALWTVDAASDRLRCAGWWRNPSDELAEVEQFFTGWSFTRGEGLPGRVWKEKTAAWLTDAPEDANFPRAADAIRLGLRGAFAFPVMFHDEFLAAMEFFSVVRRKPDAELLAVMRVAGLQIGLAMDRWAAEEALEESEERYRIVGETAADAIFTIDRNDIIQFANPAVERIFGYKPSELLGKELIWVIPERFRKRHLAGIRHFVETEARRIPWTAVRLPGLHRDGREIPLELSFGVYKKGDQFFFTGVARDVSAQVQAEEERARLLESEKSARIEATEANRAKDEFLATLSHELRTPLTSILGWASILNSGDADEETARTATESIQKSAQMQAQLIEDVLDVSRIVSGRLSVESKPVNLRSALENVLDMVRPAVKANDLHLETNVADVPPAMGDPARIEQVLWNVLGNAIKFTPAGGRIDVSLQQNGTAAEIRISDTGEGIAPDFLPLVFDRFRQAEASTTRAHGGLGLGLAIARHLVELHGGTITAESAGLGEGATFIITIPLRALDAIEPASAAPPMQEESASTRLEGLRVLAVEDDEDVLRLIARVLARAGADVATATSAAEAIESLAQKPADVLVSDIAMAGEDGYDLIRKIREREKGLVDHLPALALTASGRGRLREEAFTAGFDDYRRKPIEPRELVLAVAGLAATRRRASKL
ncbi:MAG: ATP-binding protein, partial [Acidobacteriota bacterium]|nr:ATP-binding protein [Acidobacteriota bacterium]